MVSVLIDNITRSEKDVIKHFSDADLINDFELPPKLNIIIDANIPFINGVFEPFANVAYLNGADFTPAAVKRADALIIRTRTKCNEALLAGSSVKFIATATIGTDHIDLDYCCKAGIGVANAAGCNAGGVMQYVFTALYYLAERKGFELPVHKVDYPDRNENQCVVDEKENGESVGKANLSGKYKKVLGVVGVGNVGTKVAELGEYLGFEVLRCDPLKEREQTLAFNSGKIRVEEFKDFYSLDYLLENSDIVTMHTWLDDVTRGMANRDFFAKMKDGAVFVNASRGEVVDDEALLANMGRFAATVIDVWNDEPYINRELLQRADIATPHIAGYSYEGKINGTTMAVKGVADAFGIEQLKEFEVVPEEPNRNYLNLSGLNKGEISKQLTDIFPIFEDVLDLRKNPENFEKLRSNYNYRREFYVNRAAKTANLG